ncbi:Rpn family recombination-promoting nuclease/putative transposase [bacterium]|nr:Rpn family recombination-promoting nuclease/putative transposase [bacterium]
MNDVIFKIVFGSTENAPILRALLNAILGLSGPDRIQEVQISNPYGEKKRIDEKEIILDIKARDGEDRRYNVEVQLNREPNYVERSLHYLARLFSEQVGKGEPYTTIRRTVGISILDFKLFEDRTDLHSTYRLYDTQHSHELTDVLEIHYLELSKFDQYKLHGDRTPLEKWLHILKFGEIYERGLEPLPQQLASEEGIVMALDAMKRAYADDEVREMIEARLKAQSIEATRREVYEAAERKAEAAEQKAEAAEQKAEAAEQKAEAAEQKAEAAEQKAEVAEQKAEVAEQKAEETMREAEETMREAEETMREARQESKRAKRRMQETEARLAELEEKIREIEG